VNAGLVDEVSVLILPLVDGRSEHPSSFEVAMEKWHAPAYLKLASVEQKEHGALWLRYMKA
jgi:riboflavin biosynthesis pyrimidine reductase